jgi:hypothetical protein
LRHHRKQELWAKHLTPYATAWIDWLDRERNRNGFLSFRTSVRLEGADVETGNAASLKRINEPNQFAHVLDLAHFERAGKSFEHHKLRKNTMELYGPGGELEGGDAHLMVELCVLKAADLEAEYVGCVEGTGLMFLEEIVCS